MHLRDHHDAGLIGSVNDIPNIHKSHAGAAVNRRFDVAIIEIDLSSLGSGLGFFRVRHSSIVILLRYYISRAQISLPLERYLIQCGLRFCLVDRRLVRLWIPNSQQIARFHVLAFRKIHLHKRAIDSAMNRDSVERLHRSKSVEIDRHIFLLDLSSDDRHRTTGSSTSPSRGSTRRSLSGRSPKMKRPPSSQERDEGDDPENDPL